MKNVRTLILTTYFIVLSIVSFGQCDFTISKAQVCGFELFEVEVVDPDPSVEYSFAFNDGSPRAQGTKAQHFYTAAESDRNIRIRLNKGDQTCITKEITVLASPQPAIEFLSGLEKDGVITNCGSTSDNPFFELKIGEGIGSSSISNYRIDWGDGTPIYEGASVSDVSHMYSEQGLYHMTITIQASGYPNCNEVTARYLIFNGSTPGGSIIQPPNVANLCAPRTVSFPVAGVDENVPGTLYEFFLGSSKIAEYTHPAPSHFDWTFEGSSCGYTNFGVKDAFVVKMKVSNPCNVSPPTIASVYIGESPLAEMSISEPVTCTGNPVKIQNVSKGSTFDLTTLTCSSLDKAEWSIEPEVGWNLNAGNLESSNALEVVFTKAGQYNVSMTIKNTCDTLTVSEGIEVLEAVVADADAVVANPDACAPVQVNLKSKSTGDDLSQEWTITPSTGVKFVSGSSTSESPLITFEKGGQFKIQLNCSNSCSESKWDTTIVIKSNGPLNVDPIADQCSSFTFESNLTFHEDDVVSWDFTGGTPSSFLGQNPPPISYNGEGDYTIAITTANECGESTTDLDFKILSGPSIDIQEDIIVCKEEAKFQLHALPAGGKWSGQGIVNPNNGMFSPNNALIGDNILTYTYEDGTCSSTAQMIATVNELPELNAGADKTYCVNEDTVTISGASPEGGWWTGNGFTNTTSGDFLPALAGIGDHVVYYVYDAGGTGCRDSVPLKITVLDGPELVFPESKMFCVNDLSIFNHSSSELQSISWKFGDGAESTELFPTHTYTNEGNFTVEMIGTSLDNCVFSLSEDIVVTSPPKAAFELDNDEACYQLKTNITNNSEGIVEELLWNFGDGAETFREDIGDHLFLSGPSGTKEYEISLTVKNRCGVDETSSIVKVHTAPVAQFSLGATEGCSPFTTEIVNVSYGDPIEYFWQLGDGHESNAMSPDAQTYIANNGDRTVDLSLFVSNQCGTDQMTKSLLVKDVRIEALIETDIQKGCEPLAVEFSSLISPETNVFWDFKDGGHSIDKKVNHVFNNPGIHKVSLIVDNGCARDTSEIEIDVWEKPNINISLDNEICFGNELQTINNTTKAISHLWNFGDGTFSNNTTPPHEYANVGSYGVKYLASTALGCTDSTQEIVVVLPKPSASFDTDADEACEKSIISLVNQTEGAIAYAWYFGDNTISYETNPEKDFEEKGVFDIKLVARNEMFCKDSVTVYNAVEVLPTPEVDFSFSQPEDGYKSGEIQFVNESELADAFIWDFGDGNRAIAKNPTHSYEFNGENKVTLIGSNSYGCIDSIVKTVAPDFRGGLYLPSAFAPLTSSNESALFMPKGFGLSEYRLEIFSSYGELLWSTELLENGRPIDSWDGRIKGKLLPQDVYVWKAHAKFENGSVWKGMKQEDGSYINMGSITLIR